VSAVVVVGAVTALAVVARRLADDEAEKVALAAITGLLSLGGEQMWQGMNSRQQVLGVATSKSGSVSV
jgi:hypothetical protein